MMETLLFGFKKHIGLMFKTKPLAYCLLLNEGFIHTFFCKPMDIYLFNDNLILQKTMANVKPFGIYKIPTKYKYILEVLI